MKITVESQGQPVQVTVDGQTASFGPSPATPGGAPAEPVTPNNSVLPWVQMGQRPFVFQGKASWWIQPPAGFSGMRNLSISQIPPAFESVVARFTTPDGVQTTLGPMTATLFEPLPEMTGGLTYQLEVEATGAVPDGCGQVQMV